VRIPDALRASGRVRVGSVTPRATGAVERWPADVVAGPRAQAEAGTLAPGRVATLDAVVGQRVKRGQALALVDSPLVGRSVAEFIRARSALELAERKLARIEPLAQESAVSAQSVEEARASRIQAAAELQAARTLLVSLGAVEPRGPSPTPARVAVRSPIDGVVARQQAVLGGAVTAESTLFVISASGQSYALAQRPESAGEPPGAGRPAWILVTRRSSDGEQRRTETLRCQAQVAGEAGPVDHATRTRPLRIEPLRADGACAALVPGAWAEVELERGEGASSAAPGLLVVPLEALTELEGVPTLFVAASDGSFVPRAVRLGEMLPEGRVVEAGLTPGETVAIHGVLLLKGELLREALGGD
jgi:cobalt-zinc-cadmium efflux system membrane fusion protein